MTQHASLPSTGAALRPGWWAGGLSLHERLPAPRRAASPDAGRNWAGVQRWRHTHPVLSNGAFGSRLAADQLDEAGLADLIDEPRELLAGRVPTPGWAHYIERALANAKPLDGAAAVETDWRRAMTSGLRPLLDAVRAELTPPDSPITGAVVDHSRLADQAVDQLGTRLVRMAGRTLVLELNRARAAGRLAGDTPEQRFLDFTMRLACGAELPGLFEQYPVLARLLGQACQQAVAAHRELLARLAADRADIVATLLAGVDPGALVGIDIGGDRHSHGRSVAILRFAGGQRVVYKPRPLQLHAHFNDLVGWLNRVAPGFDLRTAVVLCRPGYGWLEFVHHSPCADAADVQRFYHRQGALLALLYVLDGTDMHYENLIACADQPVLVDVETLFHPTVEPETPMGSDPAGAAMSVSVYRTALLPLMLRGENGVLDISGLGGDDGLLYPSDAVDWADPGTDTMRLVRRPFEAAAAHNRPRVGGRAAEPAEYQAVMLFGFRTAYDAIAAHRTDLVGPRGLLSRCAEDEVRFLARPTRLYSTLLDESTHPDALRDALDRDRLFDLLWAASLQSSARRRLIRHELADLWAGDIPLFTSRPGSRDVWTADGTVLRDLLDAPSLASAEEKVAQLGEVDRHGQEWLITAAMATRSPAASHRGRVPWTRPVTAIVPDPERVLAAACGVADEIVASAMAGQDRVNWLGMELIDDRHWTVLPMGAGLPYGYCGPALFLAQLAALTGASQYSELAVDAIRPIPTLLDTLAADPEGTAAVGVGFNGLGGICFALARLAVLLGRDAELLRWLDTAAELARTCGAGNPANVADGEAGGLAAMLAVHAETGLPAAQHLAGRYADRLAELVETGNLGLHGKRGFARGPAGVGWALSRFAATAAERYASAARAAHGMDATVTDLLAEDGGPDYGWCGGLSGLLLANPDAVGAPRLLSALATRAPLQDMSLCHGELGALEALVSLSLRGCDRATAAVHRRTGFVLGAMEQRRELCGTPAGVSSPGLLTGLAGIGYGLLRLGFASRVPSILLLEPLQH